MTEPEPIDAEFEPVEGEPARSRAPRAFSVRSVAGRPVTLLQLCLGVVLAGVGGAAVGIAATGGTSGAWTGTLAREIDELAAAQNKLAAKTDEMAESLLALRGKADAQHEDLSKNAALDHALRADLAAVERQMTELVVGARSADGNPLGGILDRITAIEDRLGEDASAPKTTRQVQRAVQDLAAEVEALADAQAALRSAFEQRQLALAALEADVERLAASGVTIRSSGGSASGAAGAHADPATAHATSATARSRLIRTIAAIEAAFLAGEPFAEDLAQLAELSPDDPDLPALKNASRHGAATMSELRAGFETAASRALDLASSGGDDGWDWLRVTVGQTGGVGGGDIHEVAERQIRLARRALDAGDARSAVAAIDAIPGATAGAFKGWRQKAERHAELAGRLAAVRMRHLPAP